MFSLTNTLVLDRFLYLYMHLLIVIRLNEVRKQIFTETSGIRENKVILFNSEQTHVIR